MKMDLSKEIHWAVQRDAEWVEMKEYERVNSVAETKVSWKDN